MDNFSHYYLFCCFRGALRRRLGRVTEFMIHFSKRFFIGMSIIILLIIGISVYTSFNPSDSQLFPKCPVYTVTGYKCPGCGFQRALYHLLNGRPVTAFLYNPLLFILLPYILILIFLEYFANPSRPATIKLRRIFLHIRTILVIAALIIVFTVVRNL
jgi:hypothetical protein